MTAALVVCAHGTRDPQGRETVRDVVAGYSARSLTSALSHG